ncbi:hypothetical protein, partial [uncultured Psychrobacter sp.]|uniref:hypothetical protein n=1 Tax=uncultured Psychrobacter sp. TaxID=259303 RepID=UPI002620FB64
LNKSSFISLNAIVNRIVSVLFGLDYISIVDSENRSAYTIEQEKVFKIWEKEKIVNIWFLPFKKNDEETGTTIGYTVSLD